MCPTASQSTSLFHYKVCAQRDEIVPYVPNQIKEERRRRKKWVCNRPFAFVTLDGSFFWMSRSDTRAMSRVLDVV